MVRQEHIEVLRSLAAHLWAAANPTVGGGRAAEVEAAVRESVSAECVQCGIRLTGGELLVLGETKAEAGPSGSRLGRVQMGYCARNGCDSRFYRVTFEAREGVDWSAIVPSTEIESDRSQGEARSLAPEEPMVGAPAFRPGPGRRGWLKVGAACVLLGILLLARHWYRGGSVPILREPEDFQVEVVPSPPSPGADLVPRLSSE